MRILFALVIVLLVGQVADAKSAKEACKDRCHLNYDFCLNRSTTKKGRSMCKVDLSKCRGTCGH